MYADIGPDKMDSVDSTFVRSVRVREGLHNHRTHNVRSESRHTQLAWGFLRGTPYLDMEQSTWTYPDLSRVQKIVNKFAEDDIRLVAQRFEEWAQTVPRNLTGMQEGLKKPRPKPTGVRPHRTLQEWQQVRSARVVPVGD